MVLRGKKFTKGKLIIVDWDMCTVVTRKGNAITVRYLDRENLTDYLSPEFWDWVPEP